MEIGFDVIDQLRFWNTQNQENDDCAFVLAIFLALINPYEVSNNSVNQNVFQFISDLMNIRTHNNHNRLEKSLTGIRSLRDI